MNGYTHSLSSPVIVHVYDIFKFNNYIDRLGFGVYHTGVEVYGTEYCYGGHPHDSSGIFPMEPKDIESLGEEYTFKTSITVGQTDFTETDIQQIINTLGSEFCGIEYNLLKKNCNHFCSAFIQYLCGQTLPKWINRLAETSSQIPFIDKIIPKEWLRPQDYMEDDNDEIRIYSKSFYYNENHFSSPTSSSTATSSTNCINPSSTSLPPIPPSHNHTESSATTTRTTHPNEWIVIEKDKPFHNDISPTTPPRTSSSTSTSTQKVPSFSQLHQQQQQQQQQNNRKSSFK